MTSLPELKMGRDDARDRLLSRVSAGEQIVVRLIGSFSKANSASYGDKRSEFDFATEEHSKWVSYTGELLRRMFTKLEYKTEFDLVSTELHVHGQSVDENAVNLVKLIDAQVQKLKSILNRLELLDDPTRIVPGAPLANDEQRVFIVHGHDLGAQQAVTRFIERCKIRPIILADQPDGGDTIIEKFLREASKASFAIVLLTADDTGQALSETGKVTPKTRARQNVILELGYFVGFLGRKRVCALKKGDIELPSDYVGVVYTDMDLADGWKMRLARELKFAGFEVDLNEALA